ncbi:hypothetical protein ACVCAH_00905 [Micromonospora sp. LZ34]
MTQVTIEEYRPAQLHAGPHPLSTGLAGRPSPAPAGGGGTDRPVAGPQPVGGPTAVVAGPDGHPRAGREDADRTGRPGTPDRPDRRPRHRRRVPAAQPRPWSVRQHGQPRRGAVIHRGRR